MSRYGKTSRGTYTISEEFSYELEIEYAYYLDYGDYECPPEADLEVIKVVLNGMEINRFYDDFLGDLVSDQLWEYAQANHNE